MIEMLGDLDHCLGKSDAICITTNGFVKRDGTAVMGKGIALWAKNKWFGVESKLGDCLLTHGNCVQKIHQDHFTKTWIVAFPVKPQSVLCDDTNIIESMKSKFAYGTRVPGWACKADLRLIAKSCIELSALATTEGWTEVYLPRPGVGAGELSWSDVLPILQLGLDDRFTVVKYDIPF